MRRGALIIVAAVLVSVAGTRVRAQEASPSAAVTPLMAPPAPAPIPVPSAPVALVEPPAQRVPLARRWWFWTSLGGAAVGVIVAGILLTPRDTYRGNADSGVVTVF